MTRHVTNTASKLLFLNHNILPDLMTRIIIPVQFSILVLSKRICVDNKLHMLARSMNNGR